MFELTFENGVKSTYATSDAAHLALSVWARIHDLDIHLHPGSWEGDHVVSTAYTKGGDPLFDMHAVVRKVGR